MEWYLGTKDEPVLVTSIEWDRMHPAAKTQLQHVHFRTGYCLRNKFGPPCEVKHE